MKNLFVTCTILLLIFTVIFFFKGYVALFTVSTICIIASIIMTNIVSKRNNNKQIEENIRQINEILKENGVIQSQLYSNFTQTDSIVLDEVNNSLVIIRRVNDQFGVLKIPFKNIVESEIIEDGVSIQKTSRSSQVGGALIGNAVAGVFGGIVGSLSASKIINDEIKRVKLQIVINDLENPVHTITFMNLDTPTKKDNPYYKNIQEKVTHWHKVLSVIIKNQQNNVTLSTTD